MSQCKISCNRNRFIVTGRDILLQGEFFCHKKISVTGRNFFSQEGIPYHRRKFVVMGPNFLSQEDISCNWKNCQILYHTRKFPETGRISCQKIYLLSQEEIYSMFNPHYVVSVFVLGMWLLSSLSFKPMTRSPTCFAQKVKV